MSGFARPAPWLRQLFTKSQAGQSEPGERSDNVSLTAPYDGGAYPLANPGEWGAFVTSLVGATGDTTIITCPLTAICRVLAVSPVRVAGVQPSCHLNFTPQSGTEIGGSDTITLVGTERQGMQIYCPILGPGHVLAGRHFGGDAATQVRWDIYFVQVPLGSVFYV